MCTRGARVGVVCVLVIFSHLTVFSPTDPGWASGRGRWVCTSGSQADGQQGGDKEDSDWGDNPFLCPQWEELGVGAPFCVCCTRGEAEKSRMNLGEEEKRCPNSSH